MKLFKILGLAILFLISIGTSLGAVTDEDLRNGSQVYYTLDDDFISGTTIIDSVANYNGTNNGATCGVTGIINQACDFDGVDDTITIPSGSSVNNLNFPFTISAWVNPEGSDAFTVLDTDGWDGSYSGIEFYVSIANDLRLRFGDGSGGSSTDRSIFISSFTVPRNQWSYVAVSCTDINTCNLYLNQTSNSPSRSGSSGLTIDNRNAEIGYNGKNNEYSQGILDEVAIWNEAKNASEIQEVYDRQANNVIGAQYDFTFSALSFNTINVNNETLTNPFFSNLTELNFSTIVDYQSNSNINQTYYLYYNGTLNQTAQFATNNSNGTFTLNLMEADYNISFFAENELANVSTNNYTIAVDQTPPHINNTLPAEINTYELGNVSNYVTCGDIGGGTCTINFTTDGNVINSTENYTFTTNGNQSYVIRAEDDAGNVATESGTILVNPEFYVYFTNSTGGDISNFSVNGTTYQDYMNESIYDYGLGNKTFTFSKAGFELTNFTLNFTNTSQINTSFSVPGAKIIFEFINVVNGSYIENQNDTSINIIGDSYSTSVTTQNRNYTFQSLNIVEDEYTAIVSNPNYDSVNTLFEFNGQEVLTIKIYMTPETAEDVADLIVEVQDEQGNVQNNILTQQYIWDTSLLESVLINQKRTDFSGQTSYKVILETEQYDFCAKYNNQLFCEYDKIININTQKVVISIDKSVLGEDDSVNLYGVSFPYSLTNSTNTTTNITRIQYTWSNTAQNIDEYILEVTKSVNGTTTLIHNSTSTNHDSTLKLDMELEDNIVYKAYAKIKKDGQVRTLDILTLNQDFEIQSTLSKYGLDKLLAIILVALGIGIGLSKKVHQVSISHLGVSLAYFLIAIVFPDILNLENFFIVLFVNIMAILVITKRDDLGTSTNMRKLITLLLSYVVMIFSVSFILGDLDDRNMLDVQGEEVYNYLVGTNGIENNLNTFMSNTEQQIALEKNISSPAGEDKIDNTLTTFIKLIGWVETISNIMSKIFTIPSTIYYMVGFESDFISLLVKVLDFVLSVSIGIIFYRELFGR